MVTLQQAKDFLNVFHDADDAKLAVLLAGAKDEAWQVMNRDESDSIDYWPDGAPASVTLGVLLLVQAMYQASPDDADTLRKAAEIKLWPYRICIGV